MGDSSIEWTEKSWNPTTGCDRISPGCDRCYALTMAGRLKLMGQERYQNDGDPRTSGPGFALTEHPDALDAPLHWRKPAKIFVNSMSDLFHRDVSRAFIADIFAVMAVSRRHTFQALTKRPNLMRQMLTADFITEVAEEATERLATTGPYERWSIEIDGTWTPSPDGHGSNLWAPPWPLPNVWLGVSIEDDRYTFRANDLRATPAAVRFISAEPLLGPLPSLDLTGIDWLIAGAESGRGARPMDLDWVRDLRDRCVAHGTSFFFKQDAVNGRKVHTPELDGRTWMEYPR